MNDAFSLSCSLRRYRKGKRHLHPLALSLLFLFFHSCSISLLPLSLPSFSLFMCAILISLSFFGWVFLTGIYKLKEQNQGMGMNKKKPWGKTNKERKRMGEAASSSSSPVCLCVCVCLPPLSLEPKHICVRQDWGSCLWMKNMKEI